jgi:hypothetical protein
MAESTAPAQADTPRVHRDNPNLSAWPCSRPHCSGCDASRLHPHRVLRCRPPTRLVLLRFRLAPPRPGSRVHRAHAAHRRAASPSHPPLYPLYLAIPWSVGLDTLVWHMLWSSLFGTASIVFTGLTAGRSQAGAPGSSPPLWPPYTPTSGPSTASSCRVPATAGACAAHRERGRGALESGSRRGRTCGRHMTFFACRIARREWPSTAPASRS